ncbi:PAS domain S-box protein [Deinococcus navajonensis]|uniref:PAS domain S-box protein n=1 Tax=Deinococcus navajonensis TaxID=309884 RepID=A0ABV8XRD7_9DEIO
MRREPCSDPPRPDQASGEATRLAALHRYQVLDSPPEAVFDRTVQLAAHLFKAPVALISLVDERRQWFKACHGLNLRETELSLSFCAHALATNSVLVVADARQDARFANNPLVTGDPHLRFYAGAPLVTPDGHTIGTLCVIDTEPRSGLGEADAAALQHLASGVISELELRLTLATLHRREAVHAAVVTSSLDAVIVMNEQGRITEWNPAAEQLFGYSRAEVLGQDLSECIIPQDLRGAHRRALARHLNTGEGLVLGHRMQLPALRRNGETFPAELAICALQVPGERLFTASLRDLTEVRAAHDALEASHALLRAVVDTVPEAIYVKDSQRRYTMINAAGTAQIGRPAEAILGQTDETLFPAQTARESRRRDEQVLTQAVALSYEVTDMLPGGARRTYWAAKMPAFGADGKVSGVIGVAIDITERKDAETTVRHQNALLASRVEAAQLEILERLARAAEYRDDDTGEHMHRVGAIAAGIARELGLPQETVQLIERAAPMHDVGKIGVSDTILLKPGRLTPEEFEVVQTHCGIGSNILSGGHSPLMTMAEEIARTHHERWDGSGYPRGLKGRTIPVSGRIVAVADVLDALTSERPYKRAWSMEAALAEIQTQAGKHFDPEVVAALLRLLARREKEVGEGFKPPAEERLSKALPKRGKTLH